MRMKDFDHGNISAQEAQRRLLLSTGDKLGRYLVREVEGTYIISYVHEPGNVKHIKLPSSKGHSILKHNPHLGSVQEIVQFMVTAMSNELRHQVLKENFGDEDKKPSLISKWRPEVHNKDICLICEEVVSTKTVNYGQQSYQQICTLHNKNHQVIFCPVCKKIIDGRNFGNVHKLKCGKDLYQCDYCDFKASLPNIVKSHVKNKHKFDSSIKCDICGDGFTSEDKLKSHKADRHEIGLDCERCGQHFKNYKNLKQHIKRYKGACPSVVEFMVVTNADPPDQLPNNDSTFGFPISTFEVPNETSQGQNVMLPTFEEENNAQDLKADDPRVVTLHETINLSREGRFDDVTIICGDGRFNANSFLLSAIFPALRSIFQSLSTEEDIFLSLPDVKVKELDLLFHDIHQRKSILNVGLTISSLLEQEVENKLMLSESKCDTFETDTTLSLETISDINLVKIKIRKRKLKRRRKKSMKSRQCQGGCGDSSCNKVFNNSASKSLHINRAHYVPQACPVCGIIPPSKDSFRQHLLGHEEGLNGRKICNICKKVFTLEECKEHQKENLQSKCNLQCMWQITS